MNDLVGTEGLHWRSLFSAVRRTRGPVAGGAATDDLDDTRSWLDRVEALIHSVRLSGMPRLGALVNDGELVLGGSLRDSRLLTEWLRSGEARSPEDREAVIVALALLGALPPIEDVWPDTSDPRRTAVLIAAVALAVDNPEERSVRLAQLDALADGPAARRLTDEALLRSATRSRLSVLD